MNVDTSLGLRPTDDPLIAFRAVQATLAYQRLKRMECVVYGIVGLLIKNPMLENLLGEQIYSWSRR